MQNSPLESVFVVVGLMENYSTSKPLNHSPEQSVILSCDTAVANERYVFSKSASIYTSEIKEAVKQSTLEYSHNAVEIKHYYIVIHRKTPTHLTSGDEILKIVPNVYSNINELHII